MFSFLLGLQAVYIFSGDIACMKREPKGISRLLLSGRESIRCAEGHGWKAWWDDFCMSFFSELLYRATDYVALFLNMYLFVYWPNDWSMD